MADCGPSPPSTHITQGFLAERPWAVTVLGLQEAVHHQLVSPPLPHTSLTSLVMVLKCALELNQCLVTE